MIQIDGSPDDWFEYRAPRCCLIGFIKNSTLQDRLLKAMRLADISDLDAAHAFLQRPDVCNKRSQRVCA